jgi:hypothetical protein
MGLDIWAWYRQGLDGSCVLFVVCVQVVYIFPGKKAAIQGGGVLIVPTIQKSHFDIVRVGAEAEAEKDRCLEVVRRHARSAWRALCHSKMDLTSASIACGPLEESCG